MLRTAHRSISFSLVLCAGCADDPGGLGITAADSSTGTTGSSGPDPATAGDPTGEPTTAGPTSGSASESVGDTTAADTTTTGDSSGDTTATTTDDTTAGADTDTDTTGGPVEPPKSCKAGELPYAGPLCGGDNAPCELRLDEAVDVKAAFRNDAPGLALGQDCQPHIVYSVAEEGYHGFYARRAPGGAWTTDPTPMPVATVGLVIDPADGVPRAVVDDGAFTAELHRYSDDAWGFEASILGQTLVQARGVALDDVGDILLAAIDDPDDLKLGVYADGWDFMPLSGKSHAPAVAASPVPDRPHVVTWSSQGGNWSAVWHAPPDGPETITSYGSNALERDALALAVAPSQDDAVPDVPHVLLAQLREGGGHQIVLAYRDEPGPWDVELVAEETPELDTLCDQDPQDDGETCDYSYSEVRPLAAVASRGGDVRFVWARLTFAGTLVSECVVKPNLLCAWKPQIEEVGGELFVAWRTPDGPQSALVDKNIVPRSATAAIDSTGDLHLAVYHQDGQGSTVRYLRVGE